MQVSDNMAAPTLYVGRHPDKADRWPKKLGWVFLENMTQFLIIPVIDISNAYRESWSADQSPTAKELAIFTAL